jgi:hypothetical protein
MYASRFSGLLCLLVAIACASGVSGAPAPKEEPKSEIVLPKDPKATVITYDPGAGGFIRKGEAPYLRIQADGTVTVTNLHDGARKEAKLTAKELDDLLQFIVKEQDFLKVTKEAIDAGIKEASKNGPFIAVGGAGTGVIGVQVNGEKHEVSFRGASAYLQAYPKVVPLARYVAVEKRLNTIAIATAKGK